jgi:hypothetical protein
MGGRPADIRALRQIQTELERVTRSAQTATGNVASVLRVTKPAPAPVAAPLAGATTTPTIASAVASSRLTGPITAETEEDWAAGAAPCPGALVRRLDSDGPECASTSWP